MGETILLAPMLNRLLKAVTNLSRKDFAVGMYPNLPSSVAIHMRIVVVLPQFWLIWFREYPLYPTFSWHNKGIANAIARRAQRGRFPLYCPAHDPTSHPTGTRPHYSQYTGTGKSSSHYTRAFSLRIATQPRPLAARNARLIRKEVTTPYFSRLGNRSKESGPCARGKRGEVRGRRLWGRMANG